MIVHRMRPRYRDIWFASGALAIMAPAEIKLNNTFPGSDYLFLKLDVALFPADQYVRAAVFTVLLLIIFHLMWLIWRTFDRGSKQTS